MSLVKKRLPLFINILILSLLLSGCNQGVAQQTQVQNSPKTNGQIQVQGPMTVSDNIINNNMTLKLRMYKGRYYEDWNPGAIQGTIWEGQFVAELTDKNGKIINQTDLSEFDKGTPLTFTSMFNLEFSDYNNDGDMDFTLGQYGSSYGNFYKLFTMRKNGKVEELNVKDYSPLFISDPGKYSVKLDKVDNLTFKKEYYDNSKGKYFEDIFRWDGQQFIRIKENNVTNIHEKSHQEQYEAPLIKDIKFETSDGKVIQENAIQQVLKEHPDFPAKSGEIKTIRVPTGGEAGATAMVEYKTTAEKTTDGKYHIALTKDWHLVVNDQKVFSYWKYNVGPDGVTLMESDDRDSLHTQ